MAKKKLPHKLCSTLLSLLLHGDDQPPPPPRATTPTLPTSPPMERLRAQTLVLDVEGGLLRSPSLFPYFMLVAVEAGGFLRGLLLLLLYPFLYFMCNGQLALRAMVMVSFCGLRAGGFQAGRAVLPKWFLEEVGLEGFEVMRRARRRVCVSRLPRVMVEGFLKEYLAADVIVGRELRVLWGFYTGFMEEQEEERGEGAVAMEEEVQGGGAVGFFGSFNFDFGQTPLSTWCKEIYVVSQEERSKWRPLPRHRYPRPLVFHDGRLAFRPTPLNTLAMFAWLPLAVPLAAARLAFGLAVPYKYSTPLLSATGMSWRLKGGKPSRLDGGHRGQLFVCNHRTLLDPVYVSVALNRPVRAVSYSLSHLSELISPIGRTVRLTRDRGHDGRVMARLLDRGDLVVVCPEGTTCREPYLLRFSPLFAELSGDVVPVVLAVDTSMFYPTTAGGWKCLDPLYYLANPRMRYEVQFLERVDTMAASERTAPSTDTANHVQRQMAMALGFECTMLTRKDKYLMLAGNNGSVRAPSSTITVASNESS